MKSMVSLILCSSALLLPLAAGATTPSADAPVRVVVHVSDLNLKTDEGARVLYGRLRNGARTACGDPDVRDMERLAQARTCMRSALQEAVAAVGSPTLSDLHRRHGSAAAG